MGFGELLAREMRKNSPSKSRSFHRSISSHITKQEGAEFLSALAEPGPEACPRLSLHKEIKAQTSGGTCLRQTWMTAGPGHPCFAKFLFSPLLLH